MQKKIDSVLSEIREEITPTQKDRMKIEALAKKLEEEVAQSARGKGIEAVVRVEGSVAKDTWLRKEPDIDVFMCLPPTIPRKELGEVSLEIAREATKGSRQVERFAEHPYLEAFVEGVRVNIVPCYCTKKGEWLSATDRTPFHTDYVKKRLNKTLRGEVRLLKKFMQGIGVYGAEIKTGGFSGYLCELLILHYKSFIETLRAFAQCTPWLTIDIENYYADREKELKLLFTEPLVIIDPVDKGRNVASAVKAQKVYTFVGAARAFLKTPSTMFFNRPKVKLLSPKVLRQELNQRGSASIFLTFNAVQAVPDILWGQLYRTQRSLRKLVELNDFKILRDAVWSDEKTLCVMIFELEQRDLPRVKKHLGPPLERQKECEDFLAKYIGNGSVVSGPYIENGRWVVELPRKFTDVVELLREKMKEGGRNAGVAELISQVLKKEFRILVNGEVVEDCAANEGFAEFLTDFLKGKPFWLELETNEA
jgi:tRNA nucleotidyltransferase (CCA-adding enzyme)